MDSALGWPRRRLAVFFPFGGARNFVHGDLRGTGRDAVSFGTDQLAADALDEMVRMIVAEADPEQVLLFGSRARGDHRKHSDVDLIVVEAEPFGPGRSRYREINRLRRALPSREFGVDILVYSLDEVEYWRDSINHVLARALREGRVLYERP